MPKLTIIEAAELTGKSKRTIQRYISTGKLSYIDRPDGTRLLDEGEVVAVFGIPKSSVTTVTHDASQDVTQQQMTALMQGLQQAIIEAQAPLLAQIAALTTQVGELTNRLEHKPEPVVQEDAVVIDELDDDDELPAFLRKPRSTKKAPVVDFPTHKNTNDEMPGPTEPDDDEPHYLDIPVFIKDD